jgi:glycosyltransferase involved in cell wall biosynthesis
VHEYHRTAQGTGALGPSVPEVAEEHSDAFLILVGDTGSPYGEAVRSYVAAAGLQNRVLISRVVPEPYQWYASADLLVCPSDVESRPRCALEAMAFDGPVLATEVFGLPEQIKDGENGYLCPPMRPHCTHYRLGARAQRATGEAPMGGEERREFGSYAPRFAWIR